MPPEDFAYDPHHHASRPAGSVDHKARAAHPNQRIETVRIQDNEESSGAGQSAALTQQDRDIALTDLQQGSYFAPTGHNSGPYHITLSIQESRLVLDILNKDHDPLPSHVLALKPYKRLIKDYFMIVRSYDEAMREGKHSRIEAIDMGRRGLHNEGAGLLQERLESKIALDLDTARRLFTLICVLHESTAMLYRA